VYTNLDLALILWNAVVEVPLELVMEELKGKPVHEKGVVEVLLEEVVVQRM